MVVRLFTYRDVHNMLKCEDKLQKNKNYVLIEVNYVAFQMGKGHNSSKNLKPVGF